MEGAAQYASVSKGTISRWMKEGLRHARLASNSVRVKAEDVDAWMDKFCMSSVSVDEQVKSAMTKARKKLREMRL